MHLRVRHKLVLLGTLIILSVSVGFVALSLKLTRHWIEEELHVRATAFARAIAATIGTRQEFESAPLLQDQIQRIRDARQDVLQLDVLAFETEQSRVVATSNPEVRLPFTRRDASEVLRGRVVFRQGGKAADAAWEVIAPIMLDGAVVGALAASFSPGPTDYLAARLRAGAMIVTGASILVMVLLMGIAVRLIVDRPMRRFVTAIERIEGGEAGARVSLASRDEFGLLARHFNGLMTRLQRFNEELQTRVRAATAELDQRYQQVQHLNAVLFDLQRALSRTERLALSGRIMAELAHEIGTPLHSVAGHLELLRRDLPPDLLAREAGRRLEVVEGQIARVIGIIARLLDLTRHDPGPVGPVDLSRLVADMTDLVHPAVAAAGLTLEVDAPVGVPPVHGRAPEVQQVVLNLLTNAIDASRTGGRIRASIRYVPERGEIELAVSDTGIGIPPADQRRIFDRSFTTKEAGHGMGLGLFIVSRIVREHQGRIELESDAGRGSTFRVCLPVVREAAA